MKLAKFGDFFKLANLFYTTLGMDLYNNENPTKLRSLLAKIIFYVGVINMNYVLFLEFVFVGLAIKNRHLFLEATMTLSYIGFVVVGNFKMLFVWRKKMEMKKFLKDMQHIFPENLSEQQPLKVGKYLQQCSRITMAFSIIYMIAIWTYNLFTVTQFLIYEKLLKSRKIEKLLPYIMYIPWNWQEHWSYYVLYISQDMAGYTAAAGQISSDLLLIGCATQLIMHYDYVGQIVESYQVKMGQKNITKADAYAMDMQFIRNMIQYHSFLLDLSNQMNDIFGLPLLLNFISSSFVLCFLGFQMTIGASYETLFKLCLFLAISIAQIHLICHYGQQLIDSSVNVASAVYNQNWSNADVRYQKILILMAKRAQKSAQLKATSFVLVSRGTMTEIIQMSYKFFALIKTMYVK